MCEKHGSVAREDTSIMTAAAFTLTPKTFLLVCPFLFLAGLVDSIAGGGGLISLPIYMIAGLPVHNAIATNKFSSTFGTGLSCARFIRHGMANLRLAVPSVIAAIAGSTLGAHLSMVISEKILRGIVFAALPVAAFFVLNKRLFNDRGAEHAQLDARTVVVAVLSAFVIGMYDGFYGPGTGTFLIIAFTVAAHLSIRTANAQAKIINLTTNITALTIFLLNGKCIISLGVAAALCNILGNYVGSGLVMEKGAAIVRPIIIGVLILLLLHLLGIF